MLKIDRWFLLFLFLSNLSGMVVGGWVATKNVKIVHQAHRNGDQITVINTWGRESAAVYSDGKYYEIGKLGF